MKDDQFLHDLRREPRAEFARDLRERLARHEPPRPDARPARKLYRMGPALAAAVVGVAAVSLFAFPSVRASAQAFLDLFRVRNFVAISVDPARLEELQKGRVDLKSLIGDHVETLRDPGRPQVVADPAAAGKLAGFTVRTPALLPRGLRQDSIAVQGEGEARVTVDAARLRDLLESLDIRDLAVPAALDGQKLTLHMLPGVCIQYRNERLRAALLQAPSPEVSLPQGVDLALLGEIGLRVAGVPAADAHRLAQTIDWRGTLLVPVLSGASSFDAISVGGNRGLLVTTRVSEGPNRTGRNGSVLMWSEGGKVYALTGNLDRVDLVQMAESVH